MILRFSDRRLFFPDPDPGGGGGGPKPPAPAPAPKPGDPPDDKAELERLRAENAELKKKSAPAPEDPDLAERARKAREADDKNKGNVKALEAALSFNMNAEKFLKDNASLLPKEISDIFTQASRETYDSATEKAAAIKAGVIQEFFKVQSNLDLLTPGLKSQLEDYLKLTKTSKQEKAQQIFDSVFEPAFEMLKRTKKAEALSKGHGGGSDDAYAKKLLDGSRKHYLGEKH
jgi:hypothetical protein